MKRLSRVRNVFTNKVRLRKLTQCRNTYKLLLHGVKVRLLNLIIIFVVIFKATLLTIVHYLDLSPALLLIIFVFHLSRVDLVRVRVHHARDLLR